MQNFINPSLSSDQGYPLRLGLPVAYQLQKVVDPFVPPPLFFTPDNARAIIVFLKIFHFLKGSEVFVKI